jgi:ribose transport system ATP-binding protein
MLDAQMPSSFRLVMKGVCKRFGSTHALSGVDLELRPGEVHALVGENGAGKSTLMKILSGAEEPDSGDLILNGQLYAPRSPLDARRQGVAMIYQELTLAPHLTVEANIMLGIERTRWGFIRRTEHRRLVLNALKELHHPEIDADAIVSRLSIGAQQLVEIARALLIDVSLLVLDEPTSSLTQEDARRLFGIIERLRQRRVTIVYISHFLEEVQEVADRFTVLRDGRNVGGGSVREFAREQIIELMVGRALAEQFPRIQHSIGNPVVDCASLSGQVLPRGVGFTLHRGEILGIAGIVGAGRTELLRVLFGLDPVKDGRVVLKTLDRTTATPRRRIDEGMGLLSEDRKQEGLALDQSVADNLTYSRLRPYTRFGWLSSKRRRAAVRQWLSQLRIRGTGPEQSAAELSGGNQQKLALARLLHQEADVLLLDEPTKGVDVGSKAEIYRLIGELAAQGKAIIVVSSYLPELLGVCDRLTVMSQGKLAPIRPATEWTSESIMAYATRTGAR